MSSNQRKKKHKGMSNAHNCVIVYTQVFHASNLSFIATSIYTVTVSKSVYINIPTKRRPHISFLYQFNLF